MAESKNYSGDTGYPEPPVTPPSVTEILPGLLGSGSGWRVPTVAPNYSFPASLTNQLQMALREPNNYNANIPRFGFSQGTAQPTGAPSAWGIQPSGALYAPPSPVNWAQSPWFNRPVTPPPLSWGMNPWAFSGAIGGGSGANGNVSAASWRPPTAGGTNMPAAPKSGPTSGPTAPPPMAPSPQQQQQPRPGLTWGPSPAPPTSGGMGAGGAAPAQAGWVPQQGMSPQQLMQSYNAYINQPIQSFIAGAMGQPNMQSLVEYITKAPPTVSSQLMNNPQIQNLLGGQNWRTNFVDNYYGMPSR